jgi:hypothetical protein
MKSDSNSFLEYLLTNRKFKGLWDILVNNFILVVELSSMKTFILSSIILFLQHIVICLRKGEKSNKCIVTHVTIPYFSWLELHVTRVTHIQCQISQYRFTRYGYSLYHLISYKKKEEIYNGQSQTTKGCCIK